MYLFCSPHDLIRLRFHVLLMIFMVLLAGCHVNDASRKPSVQITHVPVADPGGPMQLDYMEGRVTGAAPNQQIVLYARGGGVWWIQPFVVHSFTKIQSDSTWKNATHLGTEYAALLVEPDYHPASKLATLPAVGSGVVAIATSPGRAAAPIVPKVIHFSGYDWTVVAASSERGGEANFYDTENAWTDQNGYLHLRMALRDGRWTCAEVNMNRSLGYGTYKFVVQDTSRMEPSAVLGMYTWDLAAVGENPREMDIELSRWGNPTGKNAQYVIQPFYVPENVVRFNSPAGLLTHSFRWEPGTVEFKTMPGSAAGVATKTINTHVFTTGIPAPASETVHIDLYDFHHAKNIEQRPVEVVIEKFEYLP